MTPCERAAALLPEHWSGPQANAMSAADRRWLDEHLAACPACAGEDATWQALGGLPVRDPPPALWANLSAKLAAVEARPRSRWRAPRWVAAGAAAALLLAAGAAGGWWWRGQRVNPAPASTTAQITALRQEVESTRQLAVLSLLRQASPSDRLQGVVASAAVPASDAAVTAALLHVLTHDPSPDVRLAAIDALSSTLARAGEPAAPVLASAFSYQSSPLVQIALVDHLADHLAGAGGAASQALLRTVSRDRTVSSDVRQRAAWALRQ
ncbi:MAG TPA: zf-HC2 domain-containing protein [Terriglobales bacterium]|jgi:hypothetical protein